ncbi:MAG TPA: hypothetical protein VK890_12710, partial [Bacteroidia bacterium]|nr:hypothetical protein [Bacteroidia bacterium]
VGKTFQIQSPSYFSGINIAEKWSFDSNTSSKDRDWRFSYTGMCISREIYSIGLIKYIPKHANKVSSNTIWVSVSDIDEVCKNNGKLYLYKELINSALYRKLHLTYPEQYKYNN